MRLVILAMCVAASLPAQEEAMSVQHVPAAVLSNAPLSFYEALLVDNKKQTLEVQVSPDGLKVIKVEKKKPGDID